MRIKATGILLAMAVLMGMMAGPAAALGAHAGAFVGQAFVGKSDAADPCDNSGKAVVTGGGLGLLPSTKTKLVWQISSGQVVDVPALTGRADLCGYLKPPTVGGDVLGATCIATKGFDGQGVVTWDGGEGIKDDQSLYVDHLQWDQSLGGTFVVRGHVNAGSKGHGDLLVATVQAISQGSIEYCLGKLSDEGKSGTQMFDVLATYEVIPGAGSAHLNPKKKADKKAA